MKRELFALNMKHAQILAILFLCFVFVGCSPREEKIGGSIFIVTQGGENFKLGLVTVQVFDRQGIESYLAKTTTDLEKILKELKEQQKNLQEKQGKAASIRDGTEQQYERAKDLADETLQKIGGDGAKRPEFSVSDEVILDSDKNMLESGIDDSEKSRYKTEIQNMQREMAEKQTNWDLLKPTYLKQVDEENRLSQALQKSNNELDAYTQPLALITSQLESWATRYKPLTYVNNLPTPLATAKTDADGKFLFQLPTKGEFGDPYWLKPKDK